MVSENPSNSTSIREGCLPTVINNQDDEYFSDSENNSNNENTHMVESCNQHIRDNQQEQRESDIHTSSNHSNSSFNSAPTASSQDLVFAEAVFVDSNDNIPTNVETPNIPQAFPLTRCDATFFESITIKFDDNLLGHLLRNSDLVSTNY